MIKANYVHHLPPKRQKNVSIANGCMARVLIVIVRPQYNLGYDIFLMGTHKHSKHFALPEWFVQSYIFFNVHVNVKRKVMF